MDKSKKQGKSVCLNIINLCKVHYGKFLALVKVPNGFRVIAYSKRYRDVVRRTIRKGIKYSIISMPKPGTLQAH